VKGPRGVRGRPGNDGKTGLRGRDGSNGKDGKNGIDGPKGAPGKTGKIGKDGEAGDHIKSELKVHLNALKSYVDMKFDVLQSMMKKYTQKKGKELGESSTISKKINAVHQSLKSSLDAFVRS
jgi:hypothetical protein